MTVEEFLAAFSIISGSFLVIQAYLTFRVDRARLGLEKYLGISEKSELNVKPAIQAGTNETIILTNDGLIPIEEIEAKINAETICFQMQKGLAVQKARFEWERKTLLGAKEQAVIPLYEKLRDLTDGSLITYEKLPFSYTNPKTGKDVENAVSIPRLRNSFLCELNLEIASKMAQQSKTVKKKSILSYRRNYNVKSEYDADYEIIVNEHMGTWKS